MCAGYLLLFHLGWGALGVFVCVWIFAKVRLCMCVCVCAREPIRRNVRFRCKRGWGVIGQPLRLMSSNRHNSKSSASVFVYVCVGA